MEKAKPETQAEKDPIMVQLEQAHRLREDFLKMRIMIGNQISAIKRRIKLIPDPEARQYVETQLQPDVHFEAITGADIYDRAEKAYAKQMIQLAKQLPCHDWWCEQDGCSTLSFAALIAEAGDIGGYSSPAKLWKRLGLAVCNEGDHAGEAEKNRQKGVNTGYSKRRRMIMYRISSAIVKKKGKYRDIYDRRKAYEAERDLAGYNQPYVARNKKFMTDAYKSPENAKRVKNGQLPRTMIDLRAQRYMVKRLVCDLWAEWTGEDVAVYAEKFKKVA